MRNPTISLIVVLLSLAWTMPSAKAIMISVPNGGFEDQTHGDSGSDLDGIIPGWIIVKTSAQAAGEYNPVNGVIAGTSGVPPLGPIPGTGDGVTVTLSNLSRSATIGSGFSTFTSAASLATVEAGTYTLTVAAGRRSVSYDPDQYQIEMLLDGVVVPSSTTILNGNTITPGDFVDMVSIFSAAQAQAGQQLTVRLTHSTLALGDPSITGNAATAAGHMDNVRLEFAPVPEPSTFLLLGLGALGLVRYTRRRRRLHA